jgi:hypothetical protein
VGLPAVVHRWVLLGSATTARPEAHHVPSSAKTRAHQRKSLWVKGFAGCLVRRLSLHGDDGARPPGRRRRRLAVSTARLAVSTASLGRRQHSTSVCTIASKVSRRSGSACAVVATTTMRSWMQPKQAPAHPGDADQSHAHRRIHDLRRRELVVDHERQGVQCATNESCVAPTQPKVAPQAAEFRLQSPFSLRMTTESGVRGPTTSTTWLSRATQRLCEPDLNPVQPPGSLGAGRGGQAKGSLANADKRSFRASSGRVAPSALRRSTSQNRRGRRVTVHQRQALSPPSAAGSRLPQGQ